MLSLYELLDQQIKDNAIRNDVIKDDDMLSRGPIIKKAIRIFVAHKS